MVSWHLMFKFNHGFGVYLGTLPERDDIGYDSFGYEKPIVIGGFELMLPFLCIQLLEVKYTDE
ncbi:hypothetical protein OAQ99_04990 [Candidatus Kapabacteria bacterium]|nr:hypothetical protein [Candidatus Kapabacteria bacterium]